MASDLTKLAKRAMNGKLYCVINTPGDPFVRPARARLIWGNNTAQATMNLGIPTMMAADITGLPQKFEGPHGMNAARRTISETYNVEATYDLRGLFHLPGKFGKMPPAQFQLNYDIPRNVFPYCSILHARDPRIVEKALNSGITCVYEDHDEDHNKNFKKLPSLVQSNPKLKLVVAITEAVKTRLMDSGVPENRIIVLDSGVNSNSLKRVQAEALNMRRNLLSRGFQKIAIFSGGLQIERGIDHILLAAHQMPHVMFQLIGGNEGDQNHWHAAIRDQALSNVFVPGYLNQAQLMVFQQASDVLLATRQHDQRAAITSPLKFFEYLASGSPVVAANIPSIERHRNDDLAMMTYNPAEPETLADVIAKTFDAFPWKSEGYAANIDFARDFTWEQRQTALLTRLFS